MKINETVKKFKIERTIEEYKNAIGENVHPKQIEFCKGLVEKMYEEEDGKIYVNSNRCGLGKSTSLKAFLNQLVNNYAYWGKVSREEELDVYGAIIIHDSLEGLESIAKYKGLEDRCYFMRYDKEDDEYMTKGASRMEFTKQLDEQWRYPIVLITTQKYFKMSPQERYRLYSWRKGNRVVKIIDEKPYLISSTTIDETYLSDVTIALEKLVNGETKNYIMKCWDKIKNDLYYIRDSYSDNYDVMWIKKEDRPLLINKQEDKKFFNLLSDLVSVNTYDKISAIKQVYSEGCLFESSKDKDQDNMRKFILLHNNTDKFDADKCKCIILDATSKFDEDYRIDSEIFHVPHSFNDEKEDKDINIHHVLTSTSQKTLIQNDKAVDSICKWANETFSDSAFIATYSRKRGIYQKLQERLESKEVAYFGDIKGKNTWESYNTMAHIGLNRKSNTIYLQKYIVLSGIADKWNEMEDEYISLSIEVLLDCEKGLFKNDTMNRIMTGDIVVDTVQNVMRIKCRHFSNTDRCDIYIVCSDMYYSIVSKVNDAIGGIYERCEPEIFLADKTDNRKPIKGKEKTNPQIVKEYIEKLEVGTIIKMKDVISGTKLTRDQIKEARKSNEWCKNWFTLHKDGSKQQYIA